MVLLALLHRGHKVWERAEEFLPERMLDGSFENLPPNAWKPFGNGQRPCIGPPFSWQESLLAIALILKHFNVELVDPSYDLRIQQILTIKPEALIIRVRARHRVNRSPELSSSEPRSTGSTPAWPHSTRPSER